MKTKQCSVISHLVAGTAVMLLVVAPLGLEAKLPPDRLLAAIKTVESSDGKTSRNVYQLRAIAVYDVNRIYGTGYIYADVFNPETSRRIVRRYLDYWSEVYRSRTGKLVTDEVLARIHNGGPDGWKRKCTEKYWVKVRRELGKR